MKIKLKILFHFFLFVFIPASLFPQENPQIIKTGIYSDFKEMQISQNKLYALSDYNIFVLDTLFNKKIIHFQTKYPAVKMTVVDSINIYITVDNPYQESEIYHWNGKNWKKQFNPVINTISDIYYIDNHNVIAIGFGEIMIKNSGKWKHINPPTNQSLVSLSVYSLSDFYVLSSLGILYHYKDGKWNKLITKSNIKDIYQYNHSIYVLGNNYIGKIINDKIKIIYKNDLLKNTIKLYIPTKNMLVAYGQKSIYSYEINKEKIRQPNFTIKDVVVFDNQLFAVGYNTNLVCYTDKKIKNTKQLWKGFKTLYFHNQAKITDDEYGVVAADFNNDGYTDVFTCGLFESDHLYINNQGKELVDKAKDYHIDKYGKNNLLNLGASAGDIDNDGYIDLYISVLNGKNIILKNINGKYFVNYSGVSKATGNNDDRTNAVVFGDIDNDGDLDIFIVNENTSNRLFLNNKAGVFKEITELSGLQTKYGGNSAVFGDIDNDGDIDLFVTNWSKTNILYKNLWKETGKIHFSNITDKANVQGNGYSKSNACVFSDIDNDGDLDLFVGNRKTTNRLYINDGKGIFSDKTKEFIGLDSLQTYGAVIADFNGDNQKDIYLSNVGKNTFYLNTNGNFIDKTDNFGLITEGYSTGSAVFDMNSDNSPDIYVSNYTGESSCVLLNNGLDNNYIELDFDLYKNNRKGIGTKIYCYESDTKKLIFYDEIRGGSGYVSMNTTKKIIHIPKHKKVNLKVIFPNEKKKFYNSIKKSKKILVSDVGSIKKRQLIFKQKLINQLKNPYNLLNFIILLLVISIIGLFGYISYNKLKMNILYIICIGLLLIIIFMVQNSYFKYQGILYSQIIPFAGFLLTGSLIYYYFRYSYNKKMSLTRQNEIKNKLSRNLHDDLAATISSIRFYLSFIKQYSNKNNENVMKFLEKSEELTQDASDSVSDLVWGIKTRPEKLENIIFRLRDNYYDLCLEKNIKLQIVWKDDIGYIMIDENKKQNLYLILKEAVNNAIKYSNAKKIRIIISKNKNNYVIGVEDDGNGFDINEVKNKGNGLRNMEERAKEIESKILINSEVCNGTSIGVKLNI